MMVALPVFLAWTSKALGMRYGGLRAYRAALPLVFGVIPGEFAVGTFWELFSIRTDLPPYRIRMF